MAKKREYWRVKKREQRASRAAKLKQGLLLARGNAAMQRRKTHKQTPVQRAAMTNATQSGNVAKQKVNILPSPNVNVPNPQQAKQIKQEGAPAADLNIPPEQTICPIKLPPLPLTLALPQPEPDPTLTAETQATTLLAVASMKKLLEESLSTVSECQPNIKTEQPPCKAEMADYVSEEHLEQEMKSNIPMISLGEEDKLPLAANLTLQIKSWQADPDDLVHSCSQDPYLEASSQTGKSPPPRSSTTQDLQCTSAEGAGCPTPMSPLRRAKRLCTKKSGNQHQQNCCSQAPPKLHHSPSAAHPPSEQQSQQLHKVQPALQPPRCLPQSQPSSLQQYRRSSLAESVVVKGSMNSLQKKREYWKLMKRQQRARSKARQKGSLSHRQNSRILSPNTVQTLNQLSTNSSQSGKSQSPLNKRALQPKAPTASLTAVHSIPTLLVVSPTESTVGQSPDIIQVKPPVCSFTSSPSRGQHEVNARPAGTSCDPDISACSRTPGGKVDVLMSDGASDSKRRLMESQLEVMQGSFVDGSRVRKWTMQENINAAPAFATLTPPDNPLSSINLSPIEPLAPTPGCNSSHSSPSQEEFLRRKREYWRVKKKEQRARKAIRDRELSQRRAPGNWKPIRPAKDQNQPQCTEKQDPGYWGAACEESEHLMRQRNLPALLHFSTSDAEMGYYSYSSYTVPMEGESNRSHQGSHLRLFSFRRDMNRTSSSPSDEDPDGCFTDSGVLFTDGDHGEEDGSISDGAWRNRYLMDHDPLNQLLVCMVCGDLLYSHSLEGVRAHIEEAHPETLNLEPPECRRILDAWDEQVSQRERFFTSQLQQHGGATLAGKG
ncbi:hypothetical protein N1851_010489 [Merluccius polli]|uniref:SPIN-DOC-like zinc-finger domain-containing protein n=1 Tax=Merluccius polli TaxID=89951 RepID=A0AA47MZG0_MERPO|nr:hypothetical protein N1851_010489 [Merluccius polli]